MAFWGDFQIFVMFPCQIFYLIIIWKYDAKNKPKEKWVGLADDIFGVPEDMNMNQNDMKTEESLCK